MTWLVEDAWTVLWVGLATGVVVTLLLAQISQGYALVGAIVVAALTGALLLVERAVVTDQEQVEETLAGLAEALVQNDAAVVMGYLSPRDPAIRNAAENYLRQVRIRKARVGSDLNITINPVASPRSARATFTASFDGQFKSVGGTDQFYVGRFALELERGADRWLVIRYERVAR